MYITDREIEFLKQSNFIENEWSAESFSDALMAWEYMRSQEQVSLIHILETHRLLMDTRPCSASWKGRLRTGKVWVGNKEMADFREVPKLLKRWIVRVNTLIESKPSPDICESLCRKDHIAFEAVHPFFDGNGRIGRILLNWERSKCGLPTLVIKETEKQNYFTWFN